MHAVLSPREHSRSASRRAVRTDSGKRLHKSTRASKAHARRASAVHRTSSRSFAASKLRLTPRPSMRRSATVTHASIEPATQALDAASKSAESGRSMSSIDGAAGRGAATETRGDERCASVAGRWLAQPESASADKAIRATSSATGTTETITRGGSVPHAIVAAIERRRRGSAGAARPAARASLLPRSARAVAHRLSADAGSANDRDRAGRRCLRRWSLRRARAARCSRSAEKSA